MKKTKKVARSRVTKEKKSSKGDGVSQGGGSPPLLRDADLRSCKSKGGPRSVKGEVKVGGCRDVEEDDLLSFDSSMTYSPTCDRMPYEEGETTLEEYL